MFRDILEVCLVVYIAWCYYYIYKLGMEDVPKDSTDLKVFLGCLIFAPISAPYLWWLEQ